MLLWVLYFLFSFTFSPKMPAPTVYLSWQNDPTTTMFIHWYTEKEEEPRIGFRKRGEDIWSYQVGSYVYLKDLPININSVELFDLMPGTEYEFIVPNCKKIYRFKSLATDLTRPLCFAVGGDAYFYLDLMRKMASRIAACSADFVVVGGDIAYTCGGKRLLPQKNWREKRWITFFNTWSEIMKTRDGRLIPIIGVLGNHDVERVGLKEDEAIYKFLPSIRSFKVIDVKNILLLFLIDTGHQYQIKTQER